MNFNIDEGIYDYNFDAPPCANFDDVIVDYVDWFTNLNEIGTDIEENDQENIEMVTNSEGIQRPSTYKKNNRGNIEDHLNEVVACENPMINMKNKKENMLTKMKKFNNFEENDENEAPSISLKDKKNKPEKFKKVGNVVSKGIFHLKQTMTVCKPKQQQQQAPQAGINPISKTACKSNRIFGPLQTVNKKVPTRAVAPSFMTKKMDNNNNNNNSSSNMMNAGPASCSGATAKGTLQREREEGKMRGDKNAGRTKLIVNVVPGATNVRKLDICKENTAKKTVPVAPNLATSQRANMKKEKFQQVTQIATTIKTMTIDRQLGQTKPPPILAKPPFYKCATIGRVCGIDKKPIDHIGRIKTEEPKDKVVQDKPTARQICNANTAATRSTKVAKNLPHWNY